MTIWSHLKDIFNQSAPRYEHKLISAAQLILTFYEAVNIPGTKLKVYGPITFEEDTLEKIMGDLLRYRYFPVLHGELTADIEYLQLSECKMDLGDGITLKTKYLNHPLLCLGYRFEFKDKILCTAYDTEPF